MTSETAVGGIVADFSEMAVMARRIDAVAAAVNAAVTECVNTAHDLELLAVSVVTPGLGPALQVDLFAIRDGPTGLRMIAVELESLRTTLLAAVHAYRDADDLLRGTQLELVEHPSVVDDAVHAITALTHRSEQQVTGWLARFYPDGVAQVSRVAERRRMGPPRTVSDLLAGMKARSEISDRWSGADPAQIAALPHGFDDGTIDIRRLSGPEGVAWVINLAGTSRWDLPGSPASIARAHNPADFGADVRLMAGESTAYERGVLDAVASLPIHAGQPILLAGHSEGGMVAVAAAGALAARGLTVTNVLTAGSPIAGMQPPAGTDVLSLENSVDLVPRLDGAPNPRRPNWTTLTFTRQLDTVAANHGFDAYAVGAGLADGSSDGGVERWRDKAQPFLTASHSRMYAFRIQRVAG